MFQFPISSSPFGDGFRILCMLGKCFSTWPMKPVQKTFYAILMYMGKNFEDCIFDLIYKRFFTSYPVEIVK
jgi:hypothetical protein